MKIHNIKAPPILEEIWAIALKNSPMTADNTTTSPVPPMIVIHKPAVIEPSII